MSKVPKHYKILQPKIMADIGGNGWHLSWIAIDPKLGLYAPCYINVSWYETKEECEIKSKGVPPKSKWKRQ